MKSRLDRVLRVRALLENLSRLELERKIGQTGYLRTAAEQQQRLAQLTREDAVQILTAGDSEKHEPWLMKIADADILGWKGQRLGALAADAEKAVGQAREEMLARRLERRQVESLLSAAARAEKKVRARREQNLTDDGFRKGSTREDRKRS
ncbi:MAG: hypothetical protein WA476_18780 [Acidobacteriaceae bacterium]